MKSPVFLTVLLLTMTGCFSEPQYLTAADRLRDVTIQPARALEIAGPYIEAHATYYSDLNLPLKTHIIKHGRYYYIMRTNYPAKSFRYYMQPAVKIHVHTGEYTFTTRKE